MHAFTSQLAAITAAGKLVFAGTPANAAAGFLTHNTHKPPTDEP